ncbi:hypothetical protein DMH26_14890 [Streptomyces sp. WAC 05379]|nr:hypothetical protein DMH26_14890 [Streptomyces sp. WAC 05379]
MERLRPLGYDAATGKTAYALPAPGGALEALADRHSLKAASALYAVVSNVLEHGASSDAELATLVPPLTTMLGA